MGPRRLAAVALARIRPPIEGSARLAHCLDAASSVTERSVCPFVRTRFCKRAALPFSSVPGGLELASVSPIARGVDRPPLETTGTGGPPVCELEGVAL